jgi:hypothetical protein
MPNAKDVSKIFDFRINLVAILALGSMVFGAAAGVARFETREAHEADMRALGGDMKGLEQTVQQTFVRADVNQVTTRELREWMERIERKIEEMDRRDKSR